MRSHCKDSSRDSCEEDRKLRTTKACCDERFGLYCAANFSIVIKLAFFGVTRTFEKRTSRKSGVERAGRKVVEISVK